MTAELLIYEMEGWDEEERAALGRLLDAAGVVHRWDGDDLLVPEEAEEQVEALMDRVEFPDALEEAGDEGDDEAVYAVMSDLYVAADRIGRAAAFDLEDAGDFVAASSVAAATSPPYGVEPSAWRQVQELAESVVAAIEAEADEDVIGRDVATLRDLLGRLV
ncbi:MAG: hypothetical protein ACRDZW_10415 [Acidimicrobiales bacterium]